MRIALYGNVCNNMYAIAKALREYSEVDAHLYLPDNAPFNNLPENDDTALAQNYPFWIHRGKEYRLNNAFFLWKNNLIKELSTYDIVILSSFPVFLATFLSGPKIIFYATGSDLTVLPFRRIHQKLLYKGNSFAIIPYIYKYLIRLGFSSTNFIITQPFFPFKNAIKKIGIKQEKILNAYFPILFNTELFVHKANATEMVMPQIKKQLDKFEFKIFHPSRIVDEKNDFLFETGQWKNNSLLLYAFADFVKKNKVKNVGLYFINKQYKLDAGVIKYKQLIVELEIAEYVIWLDPPISDGFTRDELINIYSLVDIVTDDFGVGWFGSICVEGFSCSKPVISYVDELAMSKMYPWHPFLSSNSVDGVSSYINKIYKDPIYAQQQGELGRKWAVEFHSFINGSKHYAKEIKALPI